MNAYKRPPSLIIFTSGMILSGMVMILYSIAGMIEIERISLFLSKFPHVAALFYYDSLPHDKLIPVLAMRLAVGLLQIVAGVMLLDLRLWALWLYRGLVIFGMTATFFNSYYPGYFLFLVIPFYAVILYFLHAPPIEILCRGGKSFARSKGVLLLGSFETIIGLGIFRWVLVNIPMDGLLLKFATRMGATLILELPKIACLFAATLIFMAGLLTVSFLPTGRMLNFLLSMLTFILTCLGTLVLSAPQTVSDKVFYLLLVLALLFVNSMIFLILMHPNVKTQFRYYEKGRRFPRLLGTLRFGYSCFIILAILYFFMTRFPEFYDIWRAKEVFRQEGLAEDSGTKAMKGNIIRLLHGSQQP